MNFLLLAAVAAWMAAFQCVGATDSPAGTAPNTNATAELAKIEAEDDAAQAEVDKWILENNEQKAKGGGIPDPEIERRIGARFEPVRKAYEDFLRRYPNDVRAHLVYGSFLNDRQDEHGAQAQWEKALEMDPRNSAAYNNLAGRYSESGPVNKAFEYFSKAIELSPAEAAYYHSFADSLYVLRTHAAAYYGISEQEVYAKAVMLYSNALRLDPQNFSFARDLAQTYYSLKPLPVEDALRAWTNALSVARQILDRDDVYVHLARVKMLAGRFPEARAQLGGVTNAASLKAKTSLLHSLEQRDASVATNAPPAVEAKKP